MRRTSVIRNVGECIQSEVFAQPLTRCRGGVESRRLPSSSKLSDGICCATARFSTIRVVGWVYESRQNGAVFDVRGLAPCLSVGCHSGVEPKIGIVYETD